MTPDEQLKCIEPNLDAFRKMVLARASKVPAQWEDAEIKLWVMDVAKEAWVMQWTRRACSDTR